MRTKNWAWTGGSSCCCTRRKKDSSSRASISKVLGIPIVGRIPGTAPEHVFSARIDHAASGGVDGLGGRPVGGVLASGLPELLGSRRRGALRAGDPRDVGERRLAGAAAQRPAVLR